MIDSRATRTQRFLIWCAWYLTELSAVVMGGTLWYLLVLSPYRTDVNAIRIFLIFLAAMPFLALVLGGYGRKWVRKQKQPFQTLGEIFKGEKP